ncbi:hypothetical protein CEH05_01435 [Halobacillus halophilus]|uniref:DUF4064 domain-containing protein n=1 Tax=Halobacillus halophilus (strain ATCC 35676 / DSM 2266 / JCM 20832 / KCTC 3685 / LMG 17431 / NBRC 102448 / NCIMB 2269) TaxID=866895 RepID=I0JHL5_HALH3|nr:DUF4064 domain-containing protein [Halobacillus halophilus]ASF37852.1 hypothetical protein CEH05_01435 [Halobacillus halophilus]CCG43633.1 conserved hypothetical protein [Halobacillus halophilus DSM 2266]
MKRTAEIVLTVIGIVLYGLPILLSGIFLSNKDNPQFRQELENMMNSSPEMQGNGAINVNQMLDAMGTFTMVVMVAALVAIALGILSIVFLKGDKKPKAAGIILIVTAIIMTFGTVGLGIFAGVAYLIAGIVALVRKSKKPTDGETSIESY